MRKKKGLAMLKMGIGAKIEMKMISRVVMIMWQRGGHFETSPGIQT